MKISDIVYKSFSEVTTMPRFDFERKVQKQRRPLTLLAWALAFPEVRKRKAQIFKHNMEPLKKEPYILLCNHNAFYDFKVATKAIYPRRATYIVAIDGFIGREKLMREVGCYGKRKFINDIGLVKQIKHSLNVLKHVTMIYPEARYSHVGTTSVMPDSTGKLVKLLKVPVATLICHGHHLSAPVWNLKPRKVHTTADMTYIITKEEAETLSVEEINKRINEAFVYDDYAWQKANNIHVTEEFRAEGLHKVLYKCPHCLSEGKMATKGNVISCTVCNKGYEMDTLGAIKALEGESIFTHIPTWYEWQRDEVRKEILNRTYKFEFEVDIDSLPSSKGFYRIGKGVLSHDEQGFVVKGKSHNGEEFSFSKTPLENYSIHVEYNYFGRGDGISFSYPQDTFYMFSHDPNYLVTKAHFAVEELYKIKHAELKK